MDFIVKSRVFHTLANFVRLKTALLFFGYLTRPCLINAEMFNGERFFRRLGVMTFFKQGLYKREGSR